MNKIVLASNNKHKIKEFNEIYKDTIILSLEDIGFNEDIEENGTTFLENALIKAKTISSYLKEKGIECPVMAEDSGLEVDSLNGEPGIYSARYASDHDVKKNRDYLISKLSGKENKNANFICCLVKYMPDDTYIYAYGKTYGHIIEEELGDTSFGYDCIFYSHDLNKTFGEATSEEKNSVSHRKRAILELQKKEQ
ncbi:MAG: RdgB/HAM1 family non-canonical purine NTP pyrophosphatase [Bacilli bacterium]|nr:RdgB/HAM1 family non-canonical purine NTP pyrophosphatase [Bacilli bacterium]